MRTDAYNRSFTPIATAARQRSPRVKRRRSADVALRKVQVELSHSSTTIAEQVYGHWTEQAKQDVAAAVPAGLMPVYRI